MPDDLQSLAPLFDWRSAIADKTSGLAATRRHVALTLSLHMNAKGQSAMPSVQTLADESGLSRSTVKYALRDLHMAGWLEKHEGRGINGTNLYVARVPRPVLSRSEEQGLTTSGPTIGPPGQDVTPQGVNQRPPPAAHALTKPEEEHARQAEAAQRAWSPVYDALRAELYPAGASLTREEQKRLALAAREIHMAGGTPQDVAARIAAYKVHPTYAGVALTAMSLRSHWSELAPKAAAAPPCPECGVGGGQHTSDCTRAA